MIYILTKFVSSFLYSSLITHFSDNPPDIFYLMKPFTISINWAFTVSYVLFRTWSLVYQKKKEKERTWSLWILHILSISFSHIRQQYMRILFFNTKFLGIFTVQFSSQESCHLFRLMMRLIWTVMMKVPVLYQWDLIYVQVLTFTLLGSPA